MRIRLVGVCLAFCIIGVVLSALGPGRVPADPAPPKVARLAGEPADEPDTLDRSRDDSLSLAPTALADSIRAAPGEEPDPQPKLDSEPTDRPKASDASADESDGGTPVPPDASADESDGGTPVPPDASAMTVPRLSAAEEPPPPDSLTTDRAPEAADSAATAGAPPPTDSLPTAGVSPPADSAATAGAPPPADSLLTAGVSPPADSAATAGALQPADSLLSIGILPVTDTYGLIAAWKDLAARRESVEPYEFAPRLHPSVEPLLMRLNLRFGSRWFVRDQLNLDPELFLSSDSIAVTVDARIEELLDEYEAAPGVYYRAAESGGMRYLMPDLPSIRGRRSGARPEYSIDHSVDFDDASVTRRFLHEGVPIMRPVAEPYADYLMHLTWRTSRELWAKEIKASQEQATVAGGRSGLVRLTVPFEMPKAVKSIFGEGKPNLMVSGSERISFGGRSQWFPHRPNLESQRKQSKFPQLQMEQDLTIRLKGSVGDKLDVDIDQSSQAQSSFANRIKIHYKGYEDEIIRKVDLGNTSLSLPGTEYVSYGGKHTGLFGINSEAQLGPVTLNLIVSKQEGQTAEQSTSLRSKRETKTIRDFQYVRDRFFFLDDPTRDAYGTDVDPGGARFVAQIDPASVDLWLSDGTGTQVGEGLVAGVGVLDLSTPAPETGQDTTQTFYFEKLILHQDYELIITDQTQGVDQTHPYIVLNRYLSENHTLVVTYHDDFLDRDVGGLQDRNGASYLYGKMIRPREDLYTGTELNEVGWGKTHRLMLKNVYSFDPGSAGWNDEGLPETQILQEGLEIKIHYEGSIGGAENPDEVGGLRFIRYLGLDYYNQTDTGLEEGQDGLVDLVPWIDLGRGLIFFPDLQPFAPQDTVEAGENDYALSLRGRPGSPSTWDVLPVEYWNDEIYTNRNCVRGPKLEGQEWESRFYLEVSYRRALTELTINAWDIIEGSEVVTAGGRRLTKDRDYRINYQTGVIQLLDPDLVGEDEQINVTYKQASAFGMRSKTLVGAAALYQSDGGSFTLSSSWLYQREGSPDRRPRLGSEPTRTAVGEIATRYSTESMGLTRLLDRLPMLDVRRPSRISFEGGLGISFPNPNTRNDLYIDDFEGVDDDVNLRINRLSWGPSSVPLDVEGFDDEERAARRGELWWYTPYRAVKQGDLNPTLDLQEANDNRQVLEVLYFPFPSSMSDSIVAGTWSAEESWGGIVQGLSKNNLDLSRARFLDIWINDFVSWDDYQADPSQRRGTLYVDIGQMSEDALWHRRTVDCASDPYKIHGGPIEAPNGLLDDEDENRDGELDFSDQVDEDTGLDGVKQGDNSNNDYFNYDSDTYSEKENLTEEERCDAYRQINGTEANRRLDTEDLDGDRSLDTANNYFQYRIDLSDTNFVETDVRRDYAGDPDITWTIAENNGWRRIRIPLSDAYVDTTFGEPAWTDVKHLRLWFSGFAGKARLQIGSIELRSNRWLAEKITDSTYTTIDPEELSTNEEDFFPGVINNKENSDIYFAPFTEHRERDRDNVREREQSLTLEMRNFQPGHLARVYSQLRSGGKFGQDFMNYEFLEFWLNSTVPPEEAAGAQFFLRLCKDPHDDEDGYYEYRVPMPSVVPGELTAGWKGVKIRLTDLSALKNLADPDSNGVRASEVFEDGSQYILNGTPYLTSVSRITMGVFNPETGEVITDAAVWVDELRLTHVHKDADTAYRIQLRTELSDFAKVDLSYKRVGADFVSISGSAFKPRLQVETAFNASTSMPLDRLMPRSLELRMPFSFRYSKSKIVPKYRTNNDILVGEDPTDRDVTENIKRDYSLGLSRDRSRSGLLRYTLDAITLKGSYSQTFNKNPFAQDTVETVTFSANYATPLGSLGEVSVYQGHRVRLLPTDFSISLNRREQDETHYKRRAGDLNLPFELDEARTKVTRSGGLGWGTGLRPINAINYKFNQSRDLMREERASWLGNLNIGKETQRTENLTATHNLRLIRGWIEPRLSWKGNFRGDMNKQSRGSGNSLIRASDLSNDQTTTLSGDLPVDKLLGWIGSLTQGDGDGAGGDEEEDADEGEEDASDGEDEDDELGGRLGGRPEPANRTRQTGRLGRGSGGRGNSPFGSFLTLTRTMGNYMTRSSSKHIQTRGEPRLAYQLGLTRDPDVRMLESSRSSFTDATDYGFDVDFRLLRRITISTKYQRSETETRQSTAPTTGREEIRWPEIDCRWGDVTRYINFRNWLRNAKASTNYRRKQTTSLRSGEKQNTEVTVQWSPFLDLSMDFRNGIGTTLRIDRNTTTKEDFTGSGGISENTSTRISLSAKKTLNLTRTITVPVTGRTERITTRLDLGLRISLDQAKRTSPSVSGKPQVTADTRKFDFALTGRYGFSKTVTGNAEINFGENADNKNKTRTSRYIGVKLTAGFSF